MYVPTNEETIKRLRSSLMVHSYIYYRLNDSIITDNKWQTIANELKSYQDNFGYKWGFYDFFFKDWTGETGFHLPQPDWVAKKAHYLIEMRDEREKDETISTD